MLAPFENLTQFGVIKDVKDWLLPPNAWTEARSVRFQDGGLVRMKGHQEALAGSPVPAYWGLHCFDSAGDSHWIIAGLGKVYDYSSGTYTEITKLATTYGATAEALWNGGVLGNIPIINNGVDKPQMWSPVNAGTRLVDLTNWPATHLAQVVKPFKEFLFALDVTISGSRFRHRVLISHPAAPGAVPSSWDSSDPTKDVYEIDLSDFGQGPVNDCLSMGNINVVYKQGSTWGFQFVGGANKWRKFTILEESGLLDTHCVCAFAQNSRHFACSGEDIIQHNGQSADSILDKRQRRWFVNNLDVDNFGKSFAVHNQQEGECWFCFPQSGAEIANIACIWNYKDNSLTFRDLDSYSFIGAGRVPNTTLDPWDTDSQAWDDDDQAWDIFTHPAHIRRLLSFRPDSSKLFHMDFTDQSDGTNFEAYVERTGLDVIGVASNGELIRHPTKLRFLHRIWLQAEGAPFEVWIGTQEEIEGAITWANEGTFTPGTDQFIDIGKSTRLWGLRFRSQDNASWKINSFQVDVEPLGDH